MDAVYLVARFGAGAVLCLFALGKLLSFPHPARQMWRPAWLSPAGMAVAVGAVSLAELALGGVLAFGLLPRAATLGFVVVVAAVVTVYGTFALQRVGSCGCGGPQRLAGGRAASIRRLWVRNVLLFGVGGLATYGGPTLDEVASERDELAPLLAVLPLALLVALIVLRLGAKVVYVRLPNLALPGGPQPAG